MSSNMSCKAFARLRGAFSHKLKLSSEYIVEKRLEVLTGLIPKHFDCCINSCMAFTGSYAYQDYCFYCNERRYNSDHHPRRQFSYLSLVTQLQGLFSDPATVETLLYRHQYLAPTDEISDVFDGELYHQLHSTYVIIDGVEQPYHFFSHQNDIAFSLATDAYLLFGHRRKGPSATPILIQIYNLPPNIRTHLKNLICVGIIPGPSSPKDIASFLIPLKDDCAKLAKGIVTFDSLARSMFPLHAYKLFELGDIVAIEKLLEIRGHNAFCPCRSCLITGVQNSAQRKTNYYVPLATPKRQTRPHFAGHALPLRTHVHFHETWDQIRSASSAKSRENIGKAAGLRVREIDMPS